MWPCCVQTSAEVVAVLVLVLVARIQAVVRNAVHHRATRRPTKRSPISNSRFETYDGHSCPSFFIVPTSSSEVFLGSTYLPHRNCLGIHSGHFRKCRSGTNRRLVAVPRPGWFGGQRRSGSPDGLERLDESGMEDRVAGTGKLQPDHCWRSSVRHLLFRLRHRSRTGHQSAESQSHNDALGSGQTPRV